MNKAKWQSRKSFRRRDETFLSFITVHFAFFADLLIHPFVSEWQFNVVENVSFKMKLQCLCGRVKLNVKHLYKKEADH